MAYQTILYAVDAPVARVILNRPERRNAQSRLLLEELDDAFSHAAEDPTVRVIVLSGNGESFSAGHDLGSPEERADKERRPYEEGIRGRYKRVWDLYVDMGLRWRNLPKPTIAMVHGYCIFGGWMIATAMDLVVASDDAKFLSSHFQYFSVPYDVGPRKAKELLFEFRFMHAGEAERTGMVNKVVPRANLEQETLALANRIAQQDPFWLRLVKHSVNQAQDQMGYSTFIKGAMHTYTIASESGSTGVTELNQTGERRRYDSVDRALSYERERQGSGGMHDPQTSG